MVFSQCHSWGVGENTIYLPVFQEREDLESGSKLTGIMCKSHIPVISSWQLRKFELKGFKYIVRITKKVTQKFLMLKGLRW